MNSILKSKINIITGENGSGKSTLLANIADIENKKGKNVICISNTATNKFKKNTNSNYHSLKQTSTSLDKALKEITSRADRKKNKIGIFSNVLEYLEFDDLITFDIHIRPYESLFRSFEAIFYDKYSFHDEIKELIEYLRREVHVEMDEHGDLDNFKKESIEFSLEYSFGNRWEGSIFKDPIQLILKYEKELRKCKLLSRIQINLIKNNNYVATTKVSSGEASYLTTLAFILSHLDSHNNLILVDEPENSLHPRWQKNYLANILNLLHYFNPTLVLATHSPMIVIGATEENENLNLMKAYDFKLFNINSDDINIDEVMVDIFGVLTSRSRYFSYKINDILTRFNDESLDFQDAENELDSLITLGPDEKQKNIIATAKKILHEMTHNG